MADNAQTSQSDGNHHMTSTEPSLAANDTHEDGHQGKSTNDIEGKCSFKCIRLSFIIIGTFFSSRIWKTWWTDWMLPFFEHSKNSPLSKARVFKACINWRDCLNRLEDQRYFPVYRQWAKWSRQPQMEADLHHHSAKTAVISPPSTNKTRCSNKKRLNIKSCTSNTTSV